MNDFDLESLLQTAVNDVPKCDSHPVNVFIRQGEDMQAATAFVTSQMTHLWMHLIDLVNRRYPKQAAFTVKATGLGMILEFVPILDQMQAYISQVDGLPEDLVRSYRTRAAQELLTQAMQDTIEGQALSGMTEQFLKGQTS